MQKVLWRNVIRRNDNFREPTPKTLTIRWFWWHRRVVKNAQIAAPTGIPTHFGPMHTVPCLNQFCTLIKPDYQKKGTKHTWFSHNKSRNTQQIKISKLPNSPKLYASHYNFATAWLRPIWSSAVILTNTRETTSTYQKLRRIIHRESSHSFIIHHNKGACRFLRS